MKPTNPYDTIQQLRQRVAELEKERDELIEVKAAENASWNAGFNVQADQIAKLTAERDALKQQRDAERYRWINVADRLPDPEISVLVAREGRRFAEKSCHTGKEWLLESNHFPVTHWMPLPMTPQTRSEWEQMHAGIKRAAIDAAMKEMK